MKLLVQEEPGTYSFNYMWAPTFIGMNAQLKRSMEEELAPILLNKTTDEAHELVLHWLCKKFPVAGLYDYLDGIKYIKES